MRQMNLVVFLVGWVFCGTGESANFKCAGGDVSCLIDAINTSNGNGEANTIRLAPGIYSLTDVNNTEPPFSSPNGLPVIIGEVTIVGVEADATIIERAVPLFSLPRFRIFRVASTGTLVLDGVTVRGGYPGFVFTGGAVFSEGIVTITRSVVTQNAAGACGAIDLEGNASLTIRDSRIVGNRVDIGGNIVCVGFFPQPAAVSVVIDRTSVSDNSPQEGFAIAISTVDAAIISNSSISNNRLVNGIGGGISASGDVTIVNSTIVNNGGLPLGGAGVSASAGVRITNSTITNNRVPGVRGAVALHNTIVAGNLFGDCAFFGGGPIEISSLGHNLIGNPSNCGTLLSSDLTGDPGLTGFVNSGLPGGGVVRLRSDSRAIDAADNSECPSTDQQGLARPIDGNADSFRACDIGATEFYPVVNDFVELEGVDTKFIRPPAAPDSPTAGREVQITATLRNTDARDICSVAFEVVTLQGQAGAPPLFLLTRQGDLIGGEGSIVPATFFTAKPDLEAQKHARYRFRIGVSQMEPITFEVNVLGEVTAGPCVK